MWSPTHIRQGKAIRLALPLSLLQGCLFLTGCAQLPNLHSQTAGQKLNENIPAPIFDKTPNAVRVAGTGSGTGLVNVPEPFTWEEFATSAGNRAIDGVTIGRGGYRTLVLGSLAGDDPLAISLTDEFAKHIHKNSIILGGVQATFVRSANPDGEATFQLENANGAYLNRQFPANTSDKPSSEANEPEVRFLLSLLQKQQPQRVIHIRTFNGENGLIAASPGASGVANDIAEWLNFEFIRLPGKSSEGTLERFLALNETCEVITFAIPQTSDKSTLWETYGDSLMNLLLDEDFETRKLARTQKSRSSADRRSRKLTADERLTND